MPRQQQHRRHRKPRRCIGQRRLHDPAPGGHDSPQYSHGLVATTNGTDRVDLTCTVSTDDTAVQGYRVYRDAVQVGAPPVATISLFDTGVTAGPPSYTSAAVDVLPMS